MPVIQLPRHPVIHLTNLLVNTPKQKPLADQLAGRDIAFLQIVDHAHDDLADLCLHLQPTIEHHVNTKALHAFVHIDTPNVYSINTH